MNSQLSLKQKQNKKKKKKKKKTIQHLSLRNAPGRMQYLQRSTKPKVNQWHRILQSCFTACGGRRLSGKTSRMHPYSTSGRETFKSVTNIRASLYCRLLERYWQKSNVTETYISLWDDIGRTRKSMWIQERWNNRHDSTTRQLQAKCQEQNVDIYMTFFDLIKAFDTIRRYGLWKIMAEFGCPARFIAMVRQFHDGMLARVQNDGEYSEQFPLTNGVKQSCVRAPALLRLQMRFRTVMMAFRSDTAMMASGST